METCWQFKSGKAGQPSKLRGEVRKSIPRRVLKAGGAYIVVASYASGKKAIDDRLAVLRREARRSRLPTDRIYVYTCEQLADWCASHAALASRYLGLPAETLLIENWENNQQFTLAFHQTGSVTKQLDEIRAGLGFAMGKLQHLHIAGPPGVGKTRFALEIGRSPDLRGHVLYFQAYRPELLGYIAQLREIRSHALIVVDETPSEAVPLLNQQLLLAEGRLRLITIGKASNFSSPAIQEKALLPLELEPMRQIVQEMAPKLPLEHREFVVRFADGYVKLARMVCDALDLNPDIQGLELLRQRGAFRELMDRLLGKGDHDNVRQSLHVVALLTRIGWNGDLEQEGQAVAQLLKMDWLKVKNDVHRLHDRLGIAPPGGRYRYISPRPLALYLALEAIEIYGERLREIPAILPTEAARDAFYQRLGELAGFPAAKRWCQEELNLFFLSLTLRIEIRPVAGLIWRWQIRPERQREFVALWKRRLLKKDCNS